MKKLALVTLVTSIITIGSIVTFKALKKIHEVRKSVKRR